MSLYIQLDKDSKIIAAAGFAKVRDIQKYGLFEASRK